MDARHVGYPPGFYILCNSVPVLRPSLADLVNDRHLQGNKTMRANLDSNKLKAQIIASTELLLQNNTASVALDCIIQALENRKQYLRRADDEAARRAIDSKIEKIRGIL